MIEEVTQHMTEPKESDISCHEITYDMVQEVNILELQPGSLLVVPVRLGEVSTVALVDTGASTSLVQQTLVNGLDRTLFQKVNNEILGIGGIIPCDSTVDLSLEMHGISMGSSRFAVVDDCHVGYPLVLGVNFFREKKLIIDPSKKRIVQLKDNKIQWELYLGGEQEPCSLIYREVPLYTKEEVVIERGTSTLMQTVSEIPMITQSCRYCYYCKDKGDTAELYFDSAALTKRCNFVAFSGIKENTFDEVLIGKEPYSKRKYEKIKKNVLLGHVSTVVDLDDFELAEVNVGTEVANSWTKERIQEEFKIGENLTIDEKEIVYGMINTRRGVMSTGEQDVGYADVSAHRIVLYDSTPIRQKARHFPAPVEEEIEKQCAELMALDIIEPSKSPWSSPVVPIKKKDGTMRLCIDYRRLNKVTKPDSFPMPNLKDAVFNLHGTKFFTKLDLIKGYYQIPIEPDSREYTAFTTSRNHFQFKRLSFGLKNSPAAFQREMQILLEEFSRKNVIIYIDDVLIIANSFEEHLELVQKVLVTLERRGIKIKPSKCSWFQDQIEFLGHIISRDGITKSPAYVEEVQNYPRPQTVRELREFMGLINFQRKFLENCSSIAKPLSGCTGGSGTKRLQWTVEMDESFNKLKEEMSKEVQLSYPDYSHGAEKLELYVDASGYGAGATLCQWQNQEFRTIAYVSTTFSKPEQNYSTIERELASIRWAVKKLKSFLYGVPFVLFTDHKPLIYLGNMARDNARLARTLDELNDFDFEIRHVPGRENGAADAMSRINRSREEVEDDLDSTALPLEIELIKPVEGGGDALVESLWLVLKDHKGRKDPKISLPENHHSLRQILVDELIRSPETYGLIKTKRTNKALKRMKRNGQVLTEDAILAFSALYSVCVWVHYGLGRPVIFKSGNIEDSKDKRVHLQCLAGIHHNPLTESLSYTHGLNAEEQAKSLYKNQDVNEEQQIYCCDELNEVGYEEHVKKLIEDQYVEVFCTDQKENESLNTGTRKSTCSVICNHRVTATANTSVICQDTVGCAIVDSGAQICLIDERIWQYICKTGGQTINNDVKVGLSGFGSDTTPILGVVNLSIMVEGLKEPVDHPFAVVKEGVIPFCYVLGINFMNKMKLSLDFSSLKYSLLVDQEEIKVKLGTENSINGVQTGFSGHIKFANDGLADRENINSLIDLTELASLQQGHFCLKQLKRKILEKEPPNMWRANCLKPFQKYAKTLRVHLDVLYFDQNNSSVPVVSFNLLIEIVLAFHGQYAHVGMHKLLELCRLQVWHPSLQEVVRDVCRTCRHCQVNKVSTHEKGPPVLKIQAGGAFELVAVDLVELPKTASGFIACLVAVDHCSKWVCVVPLRNKKAHTVSRALENGVLSSLIKCPNRILSDNGPEFRSNEFNDLLDNYNIKHIYSTPYNPGSNGIVERVNRTLIGLLKATIDLPQCWDRSLTKAIMVYNNTYHASIGMTPSEFILKNTHDMGQQCLLPNTVREVWTEGHPDFLPYKVGQKVLKRAQRYGRQTIDKLKPTYEGPYVVTKVQSNELTYEIVEVSDSTHKIIKAHYKDLTRWNEPPKYLLQNKSYQRQQQTNELETVENDDEDECKAESFVEDPPNNEWCDSESDCSDDSQPNCIVAEHFSADESTSGSSNSDLDGVDDDARSGDSDNPDSDKTGFTGTDTNADSEASSSDFSAKVELHNKDHLKRAVKAKGRQANDKINWSKVNCASTPIQGNTDRDWNSAMQALSLIELRHTISLNSVADELELGNEQIISVLDNILTIQDNLIAIVEKTEDEYINYSKNKDEDIQMECDNLDIQVGTNVKSRNVSNEILALESINLPRLVIQNFESSPCAAEVEESSIPNRMADHNVNLSNSEGPVTITTEFSYQGNDLRLESHDFEGFGNLPNSPSVFVNRTRLSRLSISPIRQIVVSARQDVEAFRKRNRERILSMRREANKEASSSLTETELIVRKYALRSHGQVPDLPNVQDKVLESKSNLK